MVDLDAISATATRQAFCDTNAHIVFDTAMNDIEWKNPIGKPYFKTKMATSAHFVEIL